jgi:hypothetical protein
VCSVVKAQLPLLQHQPPHQLLRQLLHQLLHQPLLLRLLQRLFLQPVVVRSTL